MSADDIKLLPCPFCGGNPSFSHTKDDGRYIECGGCGASTNLRYACGDDPSPLLAEQWNRRAPSPQGDAEDDWTEFGKRFAIDLNNTLAAAEMVHKGAGEGPYEALLIGIELLAQHARLAMRRRGDA